MSARIVFDLDGTLIDSARDICAIASASLTTVGAAPLTLEETHAFVGNGIAEFVRRMRAARNIPESAHADLLADMTARYAGAVHQTEAYPGVPATLDALGQDHSLGICTNKLLDPCKAVLAHLRIDHHFSTVWGGDNPLGRKPDPAPLLAAFEDLGNGLRLYVGDSEIDAETAKRAGVPFILYTPGYRHCPLDEIAFDRAFDDYSDLPDIVADLLARATRT